MKDKQEKFYNFSAEQFKDKNYDAAVAQFPEGVLVYVTTTRQVQKVEEVRATADGARVKVFGIGSVPVDEIRLVTTEDIEASELEDDVEKKDDKFFFKK